MDWKDYYKLTVSRETLEGSHPYFRADLRIKENFTIDELLMKEFEYLNLNDQEKKLFSLNMRKIYLSQHYFKSPEFERVVENFIERLSREKDQLLTFSTTGGGVYLFLALLKKRPSSLSEKKLICYTSELPLDAIKFDLLAKNDVHLILRPHAKSVFKNFPTLWKKSNLIDLYEVSKA